MLIGPMLACNVIEGKPIRYMDNWRMFAPVVPDDEHSMSAAFYNWVIGYCDK